MDGVLQIQVGSHRGKIFGVMVHVMTYTDLGRTTVPTAVVGMTRYPFCRKTAYGRPNRRSRGASHG